MNVQNGDLSPCLNLSYVYCQKNRKHYNLKDKELPKGKYYRGNESIDEWRRLMQRNKRKTSFTVASGVDYKNLTAEGYMSYYIRPAPILGTFAIAYFVPEVVYFVVSYFAANGISTAYA